MKHQLFTPEIEHYIWRLGERGLSNSYCNSYDEKSLQQLDELFQLIKQIAPISDIFPCSMNISPSLTQQTIWQIACL